MNKLFLSCFFFVSTGYLFSQNFAYSFQGELSLENQNILTKSILEIPGIATCELRYKSDSKRGEFLFYVVESNERSDSSPEFSPTSVKSLIISKGLEPIDFRKIK